MRILGTKLASASLIGALCVALPGCGDDDTPAPPPAAAAPKPAADAVATEKPAAAAEEEGAADTAYTYNALNRRDPFKTYFDELMLIETDTKNLTELQRIELDKLSLVAVITGTATPMALLEDASGRGHTVKIGTLVGKRFGQVKQIRPGEVVVQEEFRDFTGKRIPIYKTLKLRAEEEGGKKKK